MLIKLWIIPNPKGNKTLQNETLRESSLFRQDRAEELLEDFTAEKVAKETFRVR